MDNLYVPPPIHSSILSANNLKWHSGALIVMKELFNTTMFRIACTQSIKRRVTFILVPPKFANPAHSVQPMSFLCASRWSTYITRSIPLPLDMSSLPPPTLADWDAYC